MRINQNISALNAYRNMTMTDNRLSKSLERLSSGLRINRASDDAAGLAISEKMRGQIRGLNQAVRNAQDGISLIQTAEGALNETHGILQRMRELSVQAANDTLTLSDRQEIQKEIDQLTLEIDRIANTTEFNTKKLLDGTTSALASTDKISTRVFMRDGLRVMDQFGQKAPGGGNYRLNIEANPGAAQVQKTDILKIKHGVAEETVEDQHHGAAKIGLTGLSNAEGDNEFDEGESFTLHFQVGNNKFEFAYEAAADEETTADIAAQINAFSDPADPDYDVGHPLRNFQAWGEGDVTPWGYEVDEGELIITARPGSGLEGVPVQVWYTDAFTGFQVDNIFEGAGNYVTFTPEDTFVAGLQVEDSTMLVGDYNLSMTLREVNTEHNEVTNVMQYIQRPGTDTLLAGADFTDSIAVEDDQNKNISLMLEVTGIDEDASEVTFQYSYHVMDAQGQYIATSSGSRTLAMGDNEDGLDAINFGGFQFETLNLTAQAAEYTLGDRMVINASSIEGEDNLQNLTLDRGTDQVVSHTFVDGHFGPEVTDKQSHEFRFFQLDQATGAFKDSRTTVNFTEQAWEAGEMFGLQDDAAPHTIKVAGFKVVMSEGIGDIVNNNTRIYDIDRFWDASGNFLVEDPQTITLVQGDGVKAAFTIFRDDTVGNVIDKINSAIANPVSNSPGSIEVGKGLGQGAVVGDTFAGNFATFVDSDMASRNTSFMEVEGTIVIQSAIAGSDGEIKFVGNEDVIKALSLTTIQRAEENRFNVNITDAHTGTAIASDVQVTGNLLVGAVHSNVDVEFANQTGVKVGWDTNSLNWTLTGGLPNAEDTFVHLADNTMVFHIGANPLQDVGAAIGDMRARALGVHNILVTDRDSANRSITQIDNAIQRVSGERSKMGAIQNRLEHTIANLSVAAENLTAAESRIRDLDMAQEMMEFTRNQIMLQAGTAMLAQANMKPQSVLQLLG